MKTKPRNEHEGEAMTDEPRVRPFAIALQVHERGPVYKVEARFRYRINGGALTLGYRLNRIDDVRRDAFDAVVTRIEETGRLVWHTP